MDVGTSGATEETTEIDADPVAPPSFAVAVMVALPSEMARTKPYLLTVATLEFEEDHVTSFKVVDAGVNDVVKDRSSPVVNSRDDGETAMLVAFVTIRSE